MSSPVYPFLKCCVAAAVPRLARLKTRAAFAVAAGLLVLVQLCGCAGVVGPSPSRQGESWTHKELLAHLEAKGLKHEVKQRRTGDTPSVGIRFAGSVMTEADHIKEFKGGVAVDATITLEKTAVEAKEKAGVFGDDGFAWGRFTIYGKKNWVALVRKALDGQDVSAEIATLTRAADGQQKKQDDDLKKWADEMEKANKDKGFDPNKDKDKGFDPNKDKAPFDPNKDKNKSR